MKNPWKTLTEKTAYENPWIRVSHREVLNPAGKPGIYGVVHFKNTAISIVPIDEEGNTWLVGQYRYTMDEYSWEVPEGGGPLGTEPLDSAKRELLEETGITADEWTEVGHLALSNSVSDERGMIYLARGLHFGEAEPEETEDLRVKKVPFEEAVAMVMRNEITDALAVASILKVKMLLENLRFRERAV